MDGYCVLHGDVHDLLDIARARPLALDHALQGGKECAAKDVMCRSHVGRWLRWRWGKQDFADQRTAMVVANGMDIGVFASQRGKPQRFRITIHLAENTVKRDAVRNRVVLQLLEFAAGVAVPRGLVVRKLCH